MLDILPGVLNVIRIGMDPDLIDTGGFVLTWHGFFTFVGVAMAVALTAYWSKKEGIEPDTVYSIAIWAILGGVIGARIVHVIDFWSRSYQHDPISIFYVWEGGIAILGAVLGGFAGGALYLLLRNKDGVINFWNKWIFWLGRLQKVQLPSIGRMADLTAPAMVLAMAVGRIGDIINGEHIAQVTSLPWGFVYTHPQTQQLYVDLGASHSSLAPSHPAVVYEMIWDVVIFGVLWFFRKRLLPYGMTFVLFLALYSLGRFFISFIREDRIWVVGLDEAQIISLITMIITITLLISKARLVKPPVRRPTAPEAPTPAPVAEGPGATS
jgi:phosphatidylglycerol:prolipoprotein diacylglycerol transferase